MAKIAANTYFLWIDPAGGTSYDTVYCLKSFNFPRSVNDIDASSMCGPDMQPGSLTTGPVEFEGLINIDADATTISGFDIDTLIKNKTTVGWKIGAVTPTTGMNTYNGTGYISKYNEKFGTDEVPAFDGAISIYGTYTTVTT